MVVASSDMQPGQMKFSDQMWGETSFHYAKSVKRLSTVKFDKIFHAMHKFTKVKAHSALSALKGGKDSEDDKDDMP